LELRASTAFSRVLMRFACFSDIGTLSVSSFVITFYCDFFLLYWTIFAFFHSFVLDGLSTCGAGGAWYQRIAIRTNYLKVVFGE